GKPAHYPKRHVDWVPTLMYRASTMRYASPPSLRLASGIASTPTPRSKLKLALSRCAHLDWADIIEIKPPCQAYDRTRSVVPPVFRWRCPGEVAARRFTS